MVEYIGAQFLPLRQTPGNLECGGSLHGMVHARLPSGVSIHAPSRLWSPVHESPFLLLGHRPAAKRGQAPALLTLRRAWRVETPWVLARVVAKAMNTLGC
eukprot:scaffold6172_cov117-Isochrysis_galbana.AAC.1